MSRFDTTFSNFMLTPIITIIFTSRTSTKLTIATPILFQMCRGTPFTWFCANSTCMKFSGGGDGTGVGSSVGPLDIVGLVGCGDGTGVGDSVGNVGGVGNRAVGDVGVIEGADDGLTDGMTEGEFEGICVGLLEGS
eukprot:CAMPEP_0201591430 /NCGR_PEP_ID=MMETSP0190_2-20130828/189291_1 /ASSEMBLY_ACC=CAM_ASM_000263 /TAXON_ID=37353 /ORGANISM="Rosalina sp." /LENGTH=135 /DNA_ID=CAMNT_0048049693 /DNA_START=76 /DNA_END=480 /DNA_ORIENTATION=+